MPIMPSSISVVAVAVDRCCIACFLNDGQSFLPPPPPAADKAAAEQRIAPIFPHQLAHSLAHFLALAVVEISRGIKSLSRHHLRPRLSDCDAKQSRLPQTIRARRSISKTSIRQFSFTLENVLFCCPFLTACLGRPIGPIL